MKYVDIAFFLFNFYLIYLKGSVREIAVLAAGSLPGGHNICAGLEFHVVAGVWMQGQWSCATSCSFPRSKHWQGTGFEVERLVLKPVPMWDLMLKMVD